MARWLILLMLGATQMGLATYVGDWHLWAALAVGHTMTGVIIGLFVRDACQR